MSKLIDLITRTAETVSPPIGFRPGRAAPSKSRMALIARTGSTESTLPAADYAASADAFIVAAGGTGKGAFRPPPDTVWGLWLEGKNVPQLKSYVQVGADFAILPPDSAFALPGIEKMGKILLVESSLGEGLIRTINELPADAVLLADDEESAANITWHRLMLCQRLASLLTKPLLATAPVSTDSDELQALWKAGVDGVVTTVKTIKQAEELKALRQIIDKADFPARPRRRMAALLPHIAEEPGATIAEEEEEEEEE